MMTYAMHIAKLCAYTQLEKVIENKWKPVKIF